MLVVINYEIMKKIFIEILMQFTSCFLVPIANKYHKKQVRSVVEYECMLECQE